MRYNVIIHGNDGFRFERAVDAKDLREAINKVWDMADPLTIELFVHVDAEDLEESYEN